MMAEDRYDLGQQSHPGCVDSFVGFKESSLTFTATNDLFSFDPSTTTFFSEGPQQTTIHPIVLSRNDYSSHDDNKNPSLDEFCNPQSLFTSLPNARTQHGQVTPPGDLSSASTEEKPALRDIHKAENVVEEPTQPAKTDRKRSRPTKAGTASAPKKRRRKTAAGANHEDVNPAEKARRDQCLERNRAAAHKCRMKKKERVDQLGANYRDLSAKNSRLFAEVKVLTSTVYDLKNLVFHHTDCGFAPINDFIDAEASKIPNRARVAPNASMAPQAPRSSSGSFSQSSSSFAGPGSGIFPSVEQASMETNDLESFRSSSTAPDGIFDEPLTDMLQSP